MIVNRQVKWQHLIKQIDCKFHIHLIIISHSFIPFEKKNLTFHSIFSFSYCIYKNAFTSILHHRTTSSPLRFKLLRRNSDNHSGKGKLPSSTTLKEHNNYSSGDDSSSINSGQSSLLNNSSKENVRFFYSGDGGFLIELFGGKLRYCENVCQLASDSICLSVFVTCPASYV